MNGITQWLFDTFGTVFADEIIIFMASMIPFVELKGGLLAASILGVPAVKAIVICFIANIIPMPFAVKYMKIFLIWLQNKPVAKRIMPKIKNWEDKHRKNIDKFAYWGIFLNVINPIPGTGGYSNALLAACLNLDNKKATKAIIIGLFCSSFLMTGIYYGFIEIFF